MRRSLPRFAIDLPLILAPLALLAPVWLTGRVLFWGTPFLQFVPWRWEAWEMLKAGHLPLWNSSVGMGAPLVANYQSALFYPPNWLQFLLAGLGGIGWLAWGQALLVAFHLAWAGLGTARLARQLGLGELAQVVSGLAYGLSGYLVARSGFLSINSAAAWLPWVILLVTRAVNEPAQTGRERKSSFLPGAQGWTALPILALALAMQLLAGHAQTAWYTFLLAGLWAGFLGWKSTDSPSPLQCGAGTLSAWAKLACALLFALLLASVQLLPTAEYLLQSQRSAAVGYDFAMTYSFWPWRFLTMLAPGLFGNPAYGDYQGYGNYWEDAVYIGLLPVILALGAMLSLAWGRLQRSSRPSAGFFSFWALITLAAFILALGNHTPVFPWLYRHVPTFDMFQGPTRFTIWAELGLALLAGYAVDAWRRPVGRRLYWTRLGTMGAFAVALGAGLAWACLAGIRPAFLRATALAGLLGVGAGLLSLAAPPKAPAGVDEGHPLPLFSNETGRLVGAWSWLVILFVSVDLLAAGWGLLPGTDAEIFTQSGPTPSTLAGLGRLYLPREDEYEIKFNRFFNFKSFQPESDWANLRAAWLPDAFLLDGLDSANNFDPLVPGRYAAWMEALEKADPVVREKMLNLMGVGVVVKVDPGDESGRRLEIRPESRRLRWVPCALPVAGPNAALSQVMSAATNPESTAVIEQNDETTGPFCPASGAPQPAALVQPELSSEAPDQLHVRLATKTSGWLVLSDVWYPGWQVILDGKAVPMARANFLFRAVAVPAGDHRVSFVYRPVSFYLGLLISLAAWGGLLLYQVQFRRAPLRIKRLDWVSS